MDLAGFIPENLLFETTDDCIEVDLYFELFPDFCISCHNVGHPVAKCRSVIGKIPPQPIKSTKPSVPTTNAFEVISWADAFGDLGDESDDDDYADDFGEAEWSPLQGKGSSKPSNEFDDTPYRGQ
ncbi:hypothetical protein FNV43_RR03509 [Rhamnella rubrinervis]|uniref:Zinc knuckle CX2CX4HX4C domain-containing protein n=1 Tax=Rhamnella rubrinervis TaxID=2594499 RepID=A0A8K0HJY7_9ROSA|nr:hypothetical protein FNV43_RR03509 [Rhamnella rubrinervis]